MPKPPTISDAINAGIFQLDYDPQTNMFVDSQGRMYYPDGQFDRMMQQRQGGGAAQPRAAAGAPGGIGMEALPQNPNELAAWLAMRDSAGQRVSGSNVFGQLVGNQLSGFTGYGDALNALYNAGPTSMKTPWGTVTTSGSPYAQLQEAATAQAPSNAARDIAQIQAAVDFDKTRSQREIASQLTKSLFGAMSPLGRGLPGISTDYGAGVTLPRPKHVSLDKYRPKSEANALFA